MRNVEVDDTVYIKFFIVNKGLAEYEAFTVSGLHDDALLGPLISVRELPGIFYSPDRFLTEEEYARLCLTH